MASGAPSGFVIPGGKSKDTPIEQAAERDLLYWVGRISKEIADGGSRRPDHDKKWVAAARAILEGNGVDAGPGAPSGGEERRSNGNGAVNGGRPKKRIPDSQSFSNAKDLLALLEEIEQDYNIVGAVALGDVPLGHSVVLSVVRLLPKEWIKQDGGMWMVNGNAIARIADAAGVSTTGSVQTHYDPRGMCRFVVSVARQELSGGVRGETKSGSIDLRPGTKEYEAMLAEGKARQQDAIAKQWDRIPEPDGQIRAKLKHLPALAETKGYLRAVRKLLAIGNYADNEKKAFAVLKLSFTGRCPHNPEIEMMFARGLMQASLGGTAALFGGAAGMGRPQLPAPVQPAGLLHGGPSHDGDFEDVEDDPPSDPGGSGPFDDMEQPYDGGDGEGGY